MSLPNVLRDRLTLPVIASPLFIISQTDLVIAQCKAGVVGSFPALNARPKERFAEWLAQIETELDGTDAAPFAVNLIVHRSNDRLEHDVEQCVAHRVPIVITSLGLREEIIRAIHGYGGIVLHDIITIAHARKAVERGVDGLIAVASGAGGHAGRLSPFALIHEIREWWDGPLVLSGAIATGGAILAAQAMGADLAYVGSAFIATREAYATDAYKAAIVSARAEDIVYTKYFTGVHGNYLRSSIVSAGLDPEALPEDAAKAMDFGTGNGDAAKAWRDIWGSGQGIGAVKSVVSVEELVARLREEYRAAQDRLALR